MVLVELANSTSNHQQPKEEPPLPPLPPLEPAAPAQQPGEGASEPTATADAALIAPSPVVVITPDPDQPTWLLVASQEMLQALMQSLDVRGVREAALHSFLSKHSESFKLFLPSVPSSAPPDASDQQPASSTTDDTEEESDDDEDDDDEEELALPVFGINRNGGRYVQPEPSASAAASTSSNSSSTPSPPRRDRRRAGKSRKDDKKKTRQDESPTAEQSAASAGATPLTGEVLLAHLLRSALLEFDSRLPSSLFARRYAQRRDAWRKDAAETGANSSVDAVVKRLLTLKSNLISKPQSPWFVAHQTEWEYMCKATAHNVALMLRMLDFSLKVRTAGHLTLGHVLLIRVVVGRTVGRQQEQDRVRRVQVLIEIQRDGDVRAMHEGIPHWLRCACPALSSSWRVAVQNVLTFGACSRYCCWPASWRTFLSFRGWHRSWLAEIEEEGHARRQRQRVLRSV